MFIKWDNIFVIIRRIFVWAQFLIELKRTQVPSSGVDNVGSIHYVGTIIMKLHHLLQTNLYKSFSALKTIFIW